MLLQGTTVTTFMAELYYSENTLRIYLDMCCYNRPYDDQSQLKVAMETQSKLYIQRQIKDQKLDLVSSYILRYECSNNPFEMRRNTILDFIEENSFAYVGVERRAEIEAKANEIMKTGIKFKDACHIASAIYAKCELFISTDKRLLNFKTTEIKIVSSGCYLEDSRVEYKR